MKKKYQTRRIIYFIVYTLFALVIPILIINHKYDLYRKLFDEKPSVVEITIAGMIVIIIILFFLRNHINDTIEEMEDSTTKTLYKEINRVAPLFLLFFALQYARMHIDNYIWITWWSACSNLIAVYPRIKQLNYRKKVRDVKLMGRLEREKAKIN